MLCCNRGLFFKTTALADEARRKQSSNGNSKPLTPGGWAGKSSNKQNSSTPQAWPAVKGKPSDKQNSKAAAPQAVKDNQSVQNNSKPPEHTGMPGKQSKRTSSKLLTENAPAAANATANETEPLFLGEKMDPVVRWVVATA